MGLSLAGKQPDGTIVKRKKIIGSKAEFPTRRAALQQIASQTIEINQEAVCRGPRTVSELVEHYRSKELVRSSGKTNRTIAVYEQHLRDFVLPRWGSTRLADMRAPVVEAWLGTLSLAPGTKAKTRNIMSSLYQHGMRYSWVTSNPIRLVRQSAKRLEQPAVLSATEIVALLAELPQPSLMIVRLAATTGMRRGEIFGLKWEDIDLKRGLVRIVRSLVDQVAGEPKTTGSRRELPLDSITADALGEWRRQSLFAREEDWIFASPSTLGKQPFWPNTLLVRHIRPAAIRAGIHKPIGWHTFRRSFATLLQSTVGDVKVTQELLGHASPVMTLGTYAQAVTADKRKGQAAVAALLGVNPLNGPEWPAPPDVGPEVRS